MKEKNDIYNIIYKIIEEKSFEKINILLKNITKDKTLVNYKDKTVFISASLIKVPIMLCTLNEICDNKISLNSKLNINSKDILNDNKCFTSGIYEYKVEDLLTWMITESDNSSTNVLIKFLGLDKLNKYFKKIGLIDTKLERNMLDDEAIMQGYNNYTSLNDMYLCFKYIVNNSILDNKLCKFALSILHKQKINNQIPRYIDDISFAHKTGGLDFLNSDVGVFKLNNQFYFLGISVYDTPLKEGDRKVVGEISKLICDYLKKIIIKEYSYGTKM